MKILSMIIFSISASHAIHDNTWQVRTLGALVTQEDQDIMIPITSQDRIRKEDLIIALAPNNYRYVKVVIPAGQNMTGYVNYHIDNQSIIKKIQFNEAYRLPGNDHMP